MAAFDVDSAKSTNPDVNLPQNPAELELNVHVLQLHVELVTEFSALFFIAVPDGRASLFLPTALFAPQSTGVARDVTVMNALID